MKDNEYRYKKANEKAPRNQSANPTRREFYQYLKKSSAAQVRIANALEKLAQKQEGAK